MQAPSWISSRAAVLTLLVAAGCGGGGVIPPPPGPEPSPGGAVRFALDRWPQCLNPLTSCAESSSSQHSVLQAVLPKLMWIDRGGGIEASPLLSEAPTLENGGLTPSPFTITYHLNPLAVWNDGSPITSADVRFTLKAILNTKGSVAPTGYDKIFSVATPDPTTVTLNFREPYADWYDLFGGAGTNGYVLKGSAFPDTDPDKPDLSREMNTLIPFSGGPWRMLSWSNSQLVLVRNEAYWGHQPLLDQVTFIPIEEQPLEITSLLSGTVDAVYQQGGSTPLPGGNPNVRFVTGPTNVTDALWFNLQYPDFHDINIRRAFAYGVDRQAIVDQFVKVSDPDAQVLNCPPPLFPVVDGWCNDTIESEMSRYTYNPSMSIQILEGERYDCSAVPASPCTRNGGALEVKYFTAGSDQRVANLIAEQVKQAGFRLVPIDGVPTSCTARIPEGAFQVGQFGTGGTVDPSPTSFGYPCEVIPLDSNDYTGVNSLGYCEQWLDPIMLAADRELDPVLRHDLITYVFSQISRALVVLPLFSEVAIAGWRSDRLGGPIGEWDGAPYGVFWNMDYWYATG